MRVRKGGGVLYMCVSESESDREGVEECGVVL